MALCPGGQIISDSPDLMLCLGKHSPSGHYYCSDHISKSDAVAYIKSRDLLGQEGTSLTTALTRVWPHTSYK
jgi:hypothetical protein